MNYDKLTKKELICTLIARDEMLKNCRERFELHKTTDANTIQEQSDLIDVLNKALELACEEIVEDEQLLVQSCLIEGKIWDDEGCEEFKKFLIKDFKSQAKEMVKSEQ